MGGVFICALGAACADSALARDAVPTEPSILEVEQGLAAGRFDVPALRRHYEKHIESIDRDGPKLNSVIELNPVAGQADCVQHA